MSKRAAGWTIFFVVIVGILTGTWIAVNHGIPGTPGTLSGTIDKVAEMLSGTPSTIEDQGPEIRQEVTQIPTGPTTPGQEQTEQPGTDIKPPLFGDPTLGLPFPLPGTSQPPATEAPPTTEQQPSGTLTDAGAALDQLKLQSPSDVLKACVDKLKHNDLVGAERYISPGGLSYTQGTTTGVHEVLWKGLFQVQAYQTVGYDDIKVSGQTALVPLYASLGENRMIAAYVIMAHRGDGWKLDHITDPSRF